MLNAKSFISAVDSTDRVIDFNFRFFPEEFAVMPHYHPLLLACQKSAPRIESDPMVGEVYLNTISEDGHTITAICSELVEFVSDSAEDLEYFMEKYLK